tara:strand:- start:1119 stop:1643 length:525 start_codon:yes stop_codon:yes gene_type:complete
MKLSDCFYFGKVGKPKGFRGEVNIIIDKNTPISPKNLNEIYILIGKNLVSYPLSYFKISPKGNAIGKFKGMTSDVDVNRIKNFSIYLSKEILPVLKDNQFYLHELVGCVVIDKTFGKVGVINEINNQTGQTILFVETQNNEVVIPFVDDFIVDINTSKKEVNLDLPNGIIDLNE